MHAHTHTARERHCCWTRFRPLACLLAVFLLFHSFAQCAHHHCFFFHFFPFLVSPRGIVLIQFNWPVSFSSALTFALFMCSLWLCVCVCFKFDYWPAAAAETLSCFVLSKEKEREREYTKSETVSCLAIGHFACHTLSFSGALCLLGWLGERRKERESKKMCEWWQTSSSSPSASALGTDDGRRAHCNSLAEAMHDCHYCHYQCTADWTECRCAYLSPLPRIDTRIVFCATAALYFSLGVVFFILSWMLLCCRSRSHSWHSWILSPLLSNSVFCFCLLLLPPAS